MKCLECGFESDQDMFYKTKKGEVCVECFEFGGVGN